MVMAPFSAALNPYTMPLWICCSTPAGLMTCPQSTAQTTRCTRSLPLLNRYFGHLRVVAADVVDHRDTAGMAGRKRLAPTGFLSRQFQHAEQARRFREQAPAKLERILAAGDGQFVQEALGEERVLRESDRTPVGGGDVDIGRMIIDMEIRDGVFQIDDAFHAGAIHAVAQSAKGRADHARVPSHRPAVFVQRAGELGVGRGAIQIVLHIVLARPGELHRLADGFGNFDRFADEIVSAATAKSAAQVHGVDLDLIGRKAGDLGRGTHGRGLDLRGNPNFAAIGAHVGGAIHRLHGSVRKIRHFVDGFELLRAAGQRGVDVAIIARHRAGLFGEIHEQLANARAAEIGVLAFVELKLQRAPAFHGGPGVVGDHRDAARNLNNLLDAGNGLGFRVVEAGNLAAEDRAARDHGVNHAGTPGVDAEAGGAVHLAGRVQALGRCTDQVEILGILQRDLGGHRQLARGVRETAIAQARVGRRC